MLRFDLTRTMQLAGTTLKKTSAYNPLRIRQQGTRAKAIFALALVCFFWGTTWLASSIGVRHMPALQLAGLRQFIGGVCYVLFFISRGAKLPRLRDWGPILVLSVLNFMLSNGLSTWSVRYISPGLGSIIAAIFPLWLVIIGLFKPTQKMPFRAVLGLLLGFGGVCLIFSEHLRDFLNADFRLGIFLCLSSTLAWAFGTIYTKKHSTGFNPYFSLGIQMVISGTGLYLISSFTGNSIPLHAIPWQSWASMIYLVLFGSILSFVSFMYALQRLSPGQVSLYAYINPIVAVSLSALIFNEPLTVVIALGGLMVLGGVYLVNRAYRLR